MKSTRGEENGLEIGQVVTVRELVNVSEPSRVIGKAEIEEICGNGNIRLRLFKTDSIIIASPSQLTAN